MLQNCFEYDETIIFKKANSGTVEISYVVPLKSDKTASLIAHLPISENDIYQRIAQGTNPSRFQMRDYDFRILEKGEFSEPFFEFKGKVFYRIDFQEISDLERFLPGRMIVKSKGRTLTIRREFPSFSEAFLDTASVGEKKIIQETAKLLKDGSLRFKILFPTNTECSANKGIISLGQLNYTYNLVDSLEPNPAKIWEIRLRFF